MFNLIRFQPHRELAAWPDRFDRLFGRSLVDWFGEDFSPSSAWVPPVDVTEDDHKVTIKADLPEVDQKDLKIEVADGHLTLRGERKLEREEKRGSYRRLERRYGGFARSFALPETVDADKIVADYDKGVLTIEIPKREEARPKEIPVRVSKN